MISRGMIVLYFATAFAMAALVLMFKNRHKKPDGDAGGHLGSRADRGSTELTDLGGVALTAGRRQGTPVVARSRGYDVYEHSRFLTSQ